MASLVKPTWKTNPDTTGGLTQDRSHRGSFGCRKPLIFVPLNFVVSKTFVLIIQQKHSPDKNVFCPHPQTLKPWWLQAWPNHALFPSGNDRLIEICFTCFFRTGRWSSSSRTLCPRVRDKTLACNRCAREDAIAPSRCSETKTAGRRVRTRNPKIATAGSRENRRKPANKNTTIVWRSLRSSYDQIKTKHDTLEVLKLFYLRSRCASYMNHDAHAKHYRLQIPI